MTHVLVEVERNTNSAMASMPDSQPERPLAPKTNSTSASKRAKGVVLNAGQKLLASRIEHTALAADLLSEKVDLLCEQAKSYGFAGVCIPPYFVERAANLLEGSKVSVVTVAGFPYGYQTTSAKVEEARKAFEQGANEIDMVANIAAIKNGRWNLVRDDIQSLATIAGMNSRILKVIIETGLLTEEEIVRVCEIGAELEVHYLKTSTGVQPVSATVEAVALMRRLLPKSVRIKAAGGIRNSAFAEELIAAGADRIGTSSGLAILGLSDQSTGVY